MPTNAVPYNGRAQAQGSLGQPYAGLRFITRAISLNGKYTAAYRNRAHDPSASGARGRRAGRL